MKHTHSIRYRIVFSAILTAALFAVTAWAGAPLKGVDIKLGKNPGGSPMYSARTDGDGKFTFPKLPPGVYSIYISYDQVNEYAIKENGVKKFAIKENGVKKSTKDDNDEGDAQKSYVASHFMLDIDGSDKLTLDCTGCGSDANMKRQHGSITITKEWGAKTSKVTITVSETASVVGKVTYDQTKGRK